MPINFQTVRTVAAVLVAAAGLASFAWSSALQAQGAEDEVGREIVSRYGIDLVPYAVVDRPDGSFRRMLTAPETLAALSGGGPLPDGTRVFMETYWSGDRVSIVHQARKMGGAWQYGSFSPDRPALSVRSQASCLSCHARAAETEFLFTGPSLFGAAVGEAADRFTCDRGGRRPCAPAVYQDR